MKKFKNYKRNTQHVAFPLWLVLFLGQNSISYRALVDLCFRSSSLMLKTAVLSMHCDESDTETFINF